MCAGHCPDRFWLKLFVDPVRRDTIWSANTNLDRSEDGGKTWRQVPIDYNELRQCNLGQSP